MNIRPKHIVALIFAGLLIFWAYSDFVVFGWFLIAIVVSCYSVLFGTIFLRAVALDEWPWEVSDDRT